MGADTLIGEDVYNRQQEDLGDIKEIMLDMRSGQVAYAVLSFGGILGMGEKLFAVPWQSLELDTNNKRFILDASKEQLKAAPGFDKDSWPDMASREFSSQIHDFYGTGQAMPGQRTASGSVMGQGSASLQSDAYGGTGGSQSGSLGNSGSLQSDSLQRDKLQRDTLQRDNLQGDRLRDDDGDYRDLSTPPGGSKY
jgi:surface antigen